MHAFFHPAPSGAPGNITVLEIASHSISLMWTPPTAENQNGIIIGYLMNFTVTETGEAFQLFSNSSDIRVVLTPYTQYTFILAAENNAGRGPYTQFFRVQTAEAGICDSKCVHRKSNNHKVLFPSSSQQSSPEPHSHRFGAHLYFSGLVPSTSTQPEWQHQGVQNQYDWGGNWEGSELFYSCHFLHCTSLASVLHVWVHCLCIHCCYWATCRSYSDDSGRQ